MHGSHLCVRRADALGQLARPDQRHSAALVARSTVATSAKRESTPGCAGCGAAGGARAPPRQPLPTTGVLVTTGPAAIRAGRAPNGQAWMCQGSPGAAQPLARATAAGTRLKILTLCFRIISTRATQPGTCHRGASPCRGGPADQRHSAALVARTAQLRARSASLPRGAQGAGQPEVRARPPGSFCRPAARTRHRRRH